MSSRPGPGNLIDKQCPASSQLGAIIGPAMVAGNKEHHICYVTVINNPTEELKTCCKTDSIGYIGSSLWDECHAWCTYTFPATREEAPADIVIFIRCIKEDKKKHGKSSAGLNCESKNFLSGAAPRRVDKLGFCALGVVIAGSLI